MKVVEITTALEKCTNSEKNKILELASMCTDVNIQIEKGRQVLIGEPTEIAIVNAALDNNIDKQRL